MPSNLLAESLDALMDGGLSGVAAALPELADRPRLGLSAEVAMEEYPPALREEIGLPDHGVVVTEVTPGGPADEAGLAPATEAVLVAGRPFPMDGDVITEVEGEEISRLIDLQQVVLEREAGETVELTVWREGNERSVTVALEVVSL